MNSDMVKPEKFGHFHLVYHFTLPLNRYEYFIKVRLHYSVFNLIIALLFNQLF